MKVNIFKKLIREVVREELDYKFSSLEKKLDEVLVNNRSNSIVEDTAPQLNSSQNKKENSSNAFADAREWLPSPTPKSDINSFSLSFSLNPF